MAHRIQIQTPIHIQTQTLASATDRPGMRGMFTYRAMSSHMTAKSGAQSGGHPVKNPDLRGSGESGSKLINVNPATLTQIQIRTPNQIRIQTRIQIPIFRSARALMPGAAPEPTYPEIR